MKRKYVRPLDTFLKNISSNPLDALNKQLRETNERVRYLLNGYIEVDDSDNNIVPFTLENIQQAYDKVRQASPKPPTKTAVAKQAGYSRKTVRRYWSLLSR